MKISYDGLWKILIDNKLNKTDLISMTKMGSATLAKLSKNEPVSLLVLMKICKVFDCKLEEVCCFIKE